jgi:hypothetical protein
MGFFDTSATLSLANVGLTAKATTLTATATGGILGCAPCSDDGNMNTCTYDHNSAAFGTKGTLTAAVTCKTGYYLSSATACS